MLPPDPSGNAIGPPNSQQQVMPTQVQMMKQQQPGAPGYLMPGAIHAMQMPMMPPGAIRPPLQLHGMLPPGMMPLPGMPPRHAMPGMFIPNPGMMMPPVAHPGANAEKINAEEQAPDGLAEQSSHVADAPDHTADTASQPIAPASVDSASNLTPHAQTGTDAGAAMPDAAAPVALTSKSSPNLAPPSAEADPPTVPATALPALDDTSTCGAFNSASGPTPSCTSMSEAPPSSMIVPFPVQAVASQEDAGRANVVGGTASFGGVDVGASALPQAVDETGAPMESMAPSLLAEPNGEVATVDGKSEVAGLDDAQVPVDNSPGFPGGAAKAPAPATLNPTMMHPGMMHPGMMNPMQMHMMHMHMVRMGSMRPGLLGGMRPGMPPGMFPGMGSGMRPSMPGMLMPGMPRPGHPPHHPLPGQAGSYPPAGAPHAMGQQPSSLPSFPHAGFQQIPNHQANHHTPGFHQANLRKAGLHPNAQQSNGQAPGFHLLPGHTPAGNPYPHRPNPGGGAPPRMGLSPHAGGPLPVGVHPLPQASQTQRGVPGHTQGATGMISAQQSSIIDQLAPIIRKLGEPFLKQLQAQHGSDPQYSFLFDHDESPARAHFKEKLAALGYTLATPAPAAMPGSQNEWTAVQDQAGRTYYVNRRTNESTWVKPDTLKEVTPAISSQAASSNSTSERVAQPGGEEKWTEVFDTTGRKYYVNQATGESSWTKPADEASSAAAEVGGSVKGRVLGGWTEYTMNDGRVYYSNAEGRTQWSVPDEFSAQQRNLESIWANVAATHDLNAVGVAAVAAPAEKGPETAATEEREAEQLEDAVAMGGSGKATLDDLEEKKDTGQVENAAAVGVEGTGQEGEDEDEDEEDATEKTNQIGAEVQRGMGKRARREHRRREREAEKLKQAASATFTSEVRVVELPTSKEVSLLAASAAVSDPAAAFTQMITEKSADNPQLLECDWEAALRLLITDRRYAAVKTLTQRKELFSEWQTERVEVLRKERKQARKAARDAFVEMVCANEEIGHRPTLRNAERHCSDDPRWLALEEEEREVVFEAAVDDIKKAEKKRRQAREEKQRELAKAFCELLSESKVSSECRFKELSGMEGLAADPRYSAIDEDARREAFDDFVELLLKKERVAAKRGFEALLEEALRAGSLSRKSRWRDVSDDLRPDERYATLKKISSDLPASMFDKFVENLQTRFAAHAKQAKILAASCPKLLSSDSYSDFVKAIAKQEAETIKPEEEEEEEKRPVRVAEMMEEAVRHVYKLVIDRLEQAEKEAAKKREKGRARFLKLLDTVKEMALSGTSFADWSRVREVIRDNAGFDGVETEAEREKLWYNYCEELKTGVAGDARSKKGAEATAKEAAEMKEEQESKESAKAKKERKKDREGDGHEEKSSRKRSRDDAGASKRRRRRRKKKSASSSEDDKSEDESESGDKHKRRRRRRSASRSESSSDSESSDSGERRKRRKRRR